MNKCQNKKQPVSLNQSSNKAVEDPCTFSIIERQRHDIVQLTLWLENMQLLSATIARSKGWMFIDRINNLFRSLILKPHRTTASKNLENLTEKYGQWKNTHLHTLTYTPQNKTYYNSDIVHRTINQIPYTGDVDTPALGPTTRKYAALLEEYSKREQNDLVSVIIPTFNNVGTIEKAIFSVINQIYRNFEIIIVNDGSTDDTLKVLSKFVHNERVVVKSIQNSGPAHARNTGMKLAKGDYFAYIDADNEWYPEYLLIMVNTIKDTPEIELAYCGQEVYKNKFFEKIRFKPFSRSFLENTNFIDINSVVHKRVLYDSCGGFDTRLLRLEDWDLILRYTQRKFPCCVNCSLVKYNRSDHNQNPLKNLKRRKARLRYQKSKKRIQEKLKISKVKLKSLERILWVKSSFYANIEKVTIAEKDIKTAIFIRYTNTLEYLKTCVSAIKKYTPTDTYLPVIIGNFSTDIEKKFISNIGPSWSIINPNSESYSKRIEEKISNLNKFLSFYGDVIVIDCCAVVTEGWIEALVHARKDNHDAVCIIPRLVCPPLTMSARRHVPLANIDYEVDVAISAETQNLTNTFPIDWKNGYMELSCADLSCAMVSRRVLKTILKKYFHNECRPKFCDCLFDGAGDSYMHGKIVYTPHAKVYLLNDENAERNGTITPQNCLKKIHGRFITIWKIILNNL